MQILLAQAPELQLAFVRCSTGNDVSGPLFSPLFSTFCQTPDLGQGLEFDFTFAKNNENNDNNNPHLNFPGWDGTRGLKFGTQT